MRAGQQNVFKDGHQHDEAEILEGTRQTEPRDFVGRKMRRVAVAEIIPATIGAQKTGEYVQERSFPRAIRSDDGGDARRRELDAHTIQGLDAAERFLQIFTAQHTHDSKSIFTTEDTEVTEEHS